MGGSGGGGSYSRPSSEAEELRKQIHRELEQQEQVAEVNRALSEYLAGINSRDVEAVRERLDQIQESLSDLTIDVDRLLFGGSVAKHTYVDGLSDIDALVVVNDGSVLPDDLREKFAAALRARLPSGDVQEVSTGALAVTVTYRDGTEIQLLPAVERSGHTSIASKDGQDWRQIRPHKFAEKLTEVNQGNGRAVVPTIKLAKSLIQQFPTDQKMSGYHVEAIAVDAFKSYEGRRDRSTMLRHLIDHAAKAVLNPTGDITGQSVHVDSSLGPANSSARKMVSASLKRLSTRLSGATSAQAVRDLFDA